MKIEKVAVDANLTQTAFEHVVARIAEITGEPVFHVTLITSPWQMRDAARLAKGYEDKRSNLDMSGFNAPHIESFVHYSASRNWWAVLAGNTMIWSPGAKA